MASLKELFDYQKFGHNPRLDALIRDTESRYSMTLGLDDLELVNAAGSPDMPRKSSLKDNSDK